MLNATTPQTTAPTRRLTALDSVRGIASFIVILWHCYLTLPEASRSQLDTSTWSRLLRLLTNGEASVIIFFVLSGYVLALPFFRGTQPSYPRYLFKRICRIYIPFAVAICIAALLSRITDVRQSLDGAGGWFNVGWFDFHQWLRLGPSVFVRHFMMTGIQQDMALDSAMWSLVYEMRVSLIFPLLVILCRDTRLALVAAAIMLVTSTKILRALGETGPWGENNNFWITILWTVRIMPYFVVGILLSKHSENIRRFIQRVPKGMRLALGAVPIIIFTIPHSYMYSRNDGLYDIGAAMVIVLALNIPSMSALLNRAALQWLGRISYSLYLIHTPILLLIFYALLGHVPFWFIALATIVASLTIATLMQRFVEIPAIKLGQRVARARPTIPIAAAD